MQLVFSPQVFEKNTQISVLMKIRPEEDEFLNAGGRTFDEANSPFSDFCKRALKQQDYDSQTVKYSYLFNSPNFLAS